MTCYHKISCNDNFPEFPHKANIHNSMLCSIILFAIYCLHCKMWPMLPTTVTTIPNRTTYRICQSTTRICWKDNFKFIQLAQDSAKHQNRPSSNPISRHRSIVVSTHYLCSGQDKILIPQTNRIRRYSRHKLPSCTVNFPQSAAHSMRGD